MMTDEQLVAAARLQFDLDVRPATGGSQPEPDRPLTIPEVAALLRRSEKGTYRLAAAGKLPGAKKIGGRWIVRPSELLRSVPEGRVPPGRSRR
jgi:predicted DNA-binding transcriptional regulator AlpA